jgi:hypothetical protein
LNGRATRPNAAPRLSFRPRTLPTPFRRPPQARARAEKIGEKRDKLQEKADDAYDKFDEKVAEANENYDEKRAKILSKQ